MKEKWKVIEQHPDYSVSNQGRIKNNNTERVLKPFKVGGHNNQYYAVDIHKRNLKVHRLVAIAFIPNCENKREVNHKDGNHFNNSADNLEWVTGSENCIHAYRVLNKQKLVGSDNPYSRRIVRIEDGMIFGSLNEAVKYCGMKGHSQLSRVLNGQAKTCAGYHWKYAEVSNERA